MEPLNDGSECPSCGALFFGKETFCVECGESLAASKADNEEDRRQAAAEMRRATKRVSRLKLLVTWNLVMSVLATPAVILIVVAGEFSRGMAFFLIGLQLVVLTLAILCRVFFDRRPFAIILTLASVQTLSAILALIQGTNWIGSAVWAFLLWGLSTDAAQVARLARQYPDLYLSRRMRGEHLSAKDGGRSESPAQRRIRMDRARASRKLWTWVGIGAGTVVVAVIAFFGYKSATAPPPPDDAIARFQAAWNADDVEALYPQALSRNREKWRKQFAIVGRRNDWGDQLPPIETAEVRLRGVDRASVTFEGEGGWFVVHFGFKEERWGFTGIDLKHVKTWRPDQ